MWRYLAGGLSALLLVAAGLFWWQNRSAGHVGKVAPRPSPPRPSGTPPRRSRPRPPPRDKAREDKRFARYDKDRDGNVTRDEYLVLRHRAFEKLDTNGDGRLSFDEYAAKAIKRFGEADEDKSGALNSAEFATTRPVRRTPATPQCDCSAAVQACLGGAEDDN